MELNITDPAFLFPGISLLFLAYTNRYLTLAGIIRSLNEHLDEPGSSNRLQQIKSLHLRVQLIKYMQAAGVIAFLFCICSMLALALEFDTIARATFIASLATLAISLLMALIEILLSGISLRIELDRTRNKN